MEWQKYFFSIKQLSCFKLTNTNCSEITSYKDKVVIRSEQSDTLKVFFCTCNLKYHHACCDFQCVFMLYCFIVIHDVISSIILQFVFMLHCLVS